jgi:hypothetical protein
MRKSIILKHIVFLLLISICIAGCSTMDSSSIQIPTSVKNTLPSPSFQKDSDNAVTGEGLWGVYEGYLDAEHAEASLTPYRDNASGVPESVETDITSFLKAIPCPDCVKIVGVKIDSEGHPVLKIGVKHPFAPGNPANPPTALNRLDLHVFNVRGFIVADGNASLTDFEGTGLKVAGFDLLNADGMSNEFDTYWDDILATQSNLHPYILHFDDYSVGNFDPASPYGFTEITNPSGNLVMKMGSDFDVQEYVFDLKSTQQFNFLYTLTASYGISSANKNQRLEPTYRIPLFNSKAASEVRVTNVDDDDFTSGDQTSNCILTVEIMDINNGVAVGDGIDQMTADSSVLGFKVEIPGVTNPVWETSTPSLYFVSGDGRSAPLIYDIVVTNDKGAPAGQYQGLVGVIDAFTYAGVLPGNAIYYVQPGGDPTENFFSVDQWVTYTTFDVAVKQGCGPITGSITTPSTSSITINNEDMVNFTGNGSSANGGNPIVKYEWYWNDGTPKSTGASVSHQFVNPNCDTSMESIMYNVTLTLTDSCVPPNVKLVDSIQVTVECPDCIDMYEDFDGGTDGDWLVDDWAFSYTDNSGLYYGGWDEYINQMGSINCGQSMCKSQNCFFTSGDNTAESLSPGFCNDYSGSGHYYLTSPVIDLSEVTVTQVTMSVWHFYQVLVGAQIDGCAVYASTDGGSTFPVQVAAISGQAYTHTFNAGARIGDSCFSDLIPGSSSAETVFDLTPFKGQPDVVLRFEQHNNNNGAVGTPGFPVGWWIDDITINICE